MLLAALLLVLTACLFPLSATAQSLRFSNHREVAIPDDWVLRIGPFYSTVTFSQAAGYRYTRSTGTGTDFLYGNRRGAIVEDGQEFPIVSTLDLRNYVIITKHTDLDISMRLSYAHFPLDTQEDEFTVDIAEEGITGNLSGEFRLTSFVRGTVYDNVLYKTDFVDTRGLTDEYGGSRYEYLRNQAGLNMDWLVARRSNLGLSLSRTDNLPQDDDFDSQDYYTYHEGLVFEQQLLDFLVVGASADFRQTYYDSTNREDTAIQSFNAFASGSRGAGAGFPLTPVSTLTLRAGIASGAAISSETTNDIEEAQAVSGGATLKTQLSKHWSHQLDYTTGLRGGFTTEFEEFDTYSYSLSWNGMVAAANLFSRYSEVDPNREDVNMYTDWTSGVALKYPITRRIILGIDSSYSQRENEKIGADTEADEEWRSDYNTWRSRAGTAFNLSRKITFSTYYHHIERSSDSSDLTYERDVFTAMLKYSHKF